MPFGGGRLPKLLIRDYKYMHLFTLWVIRMGINILMRPVAVGGGEETKIFLLYFFCFQFVTLTSSTFYSSHVIVHCLCFFAAIY